MAEVKRLNYFNGQFLVEKDFQDEQSYHVDVSRRHNAVLHSWGVARGLAVSKTGDKQITVSAGAAVDRDGKEIALLGPQVLDLATLGANAVVYVTVRYQEAFDPADHYTSGGLDKYTRTVERPLVEAKTAVPPGDGSVVPLARVTLDASGNVPGTAGAIDTSVQTQAGAKLAPGAVSSGQIADGAVTEAKLADNSVTMAKIRDGNVGTAELADLSVSEQKLANGAVSNAKLRDGHVGTTKLADLAVTEQKLADGSVSAGKIRDGHVITTKLADQSVTEQKLADSSVSAGKIRDGHVGTAKLADWSVTEQKLANGAVTAAKIRDGNVGTAELADGSIPLTKLKLRLIWDSSVTLPANATSGNFNTLSVLVSQGRGAIVFVSAFTTTPNGSFEWSERSFSGGAAPNYVVNQGVSFHNLSAMTIEVKFKIWELLPE